MFESVAFYPLVCMSSWPVPSFCTSIIATHAFCKMTLNLKRAMQALDLCTQTHIPYANIHSIHITVTLSRNGEETFRGFFVQARLAADSTTRVGTFAVRDGSTGIQLSNCPTPSVSYILLIYSAL